MEVPLQRQNIYVHYTPMFVSILVLMEVPLQPKSDYRKYNYNHMFQSLF